MCVNEQKPHRQECLCHNASKNQHRQECCATKPVTVFGVVVAQAFLPVWFLMWVLSNLGLQHLYGFFHLPVMAAQEIAGPVIHEDVRRHTVVLHVLSSGVEHT